VANDLFGLVTERQKRGGVDLLGLATGLSLVDKYTGGMQPDQMWLVGAVTSGGKSAFGLDVTLAAARQGDTAVYFSLEMSAESLTNRLISRVTKLDGQRILRGKINKTELGRVKDAVDELAELPLVVFDSSVSSDQIQTKTLELAEKTDIGFVCVDYAQMLRDPNVHGETDRVGNISGAIRTLARPDYLNVPVMLLSQLNRQSQTRENRIPQLHDFKGASDLEQDAEVALLLDRPYKRLMEEGAPPKDIEDDAKIIIAKNRNGMTLATPAEFHASTTTWIQ